MDEFPLSFILIHSACLSAGAGSQFSSWCSRASRANVQFLHSVSIKRKKEKVKPSGLNCLFRLESSPDT